MARNKRKANPLHRTQEHRRFHDVDDAKQYDKVDKIDEIPSLEFEDKIKVTTNPDRSFKRFPQLPLELRIAVWTHALHSKELLDIEYVKTWLDQDLFRGPSPRIAGLFCRPSASKAKLLEVSHEARREALKTLRRFGDRAAFFNPLTDIVKPPDMVVTRTRSTFAMIYLTGRTFEMSA